MWVVDGGSFPGSDLRLRFVAPPSLAFGDKGLVVTFTPPSEVSHAALYLHVDGDKLFYDGDNAEIKVDGQTFATGVLEGCELSYESPVWLEERSEGDIQWSVIGHETEVQAKVDCGLPQGVDWIGYEEIQIIESEDPAMSPGCSYRVSVTGEYVD